jgi:tetratricopeptide (TPR) repeat protein
MKSKPDLENSAVSTMGWRWHLSLGWLLGWFGYHRFAVRHFQSATKLRPKHLVAYFQLGWTYGKLGLYEKAISVFDSALQMSPNRAYPTHTRRSVVSAWEDTKKLLMGSNAQSESSRVTAP